MGVLFDLPDENTLYYENGQLERQEFCKNGIRIEGKYWHKNGQLEDHVFYNGNEREGSSKSWYENGSIRINTFYQKNRRHGKYTCYHPNSRVKLHTFCRAGKIEGESRLYDADGSLKEHFYWINGKRLNEHFTKRNIFLRLKRNLYSRVHFDDVNSFLISDLFNIFLK